MEMLPKDEITVERKTTRLDEAFKALNRRDFLPTGTDMTADLTKAIPIGYGKSSTKPETIRLMLEALDVQKHESVLEIGTGSGYQTAILAQLALRVISYEIIPELLLRAKWVVQGKYELFSVDFRTGDGLNAFAPNAMQLFDKIIVSAAIPRNTFYDLIRLVSSTGAIVAPVDLDGSQAILIYKRVSPGDWSMKEVAPGSFAPAELP